tara:strand:- start:118 stop:408 length:291 start_codon:yes stop_codon:yes gene_type:complete
LSFIIVKKLAWFSWSKLSISFLKELSAKEVYSQSEKYSNIPFSVMIIGVPKVDFANKKFCTLSLTGKFNWLYNVLMEISKKINIILIFSKIVNFEH